MVVKKSSNSYASEKTLLKYNILPLKAFKKCKSCKKISYRTPTPCEASYRSNENIECNKKIHICDDCFSPEDVYLCKKHYNLKAYDDIFCEFTGQEYSDSPVYYYNYFGSVRRTRKCKCEKCNKDYYACGIHGYNSPHKYKNCATCLIDTFYCPDFVHGVRDHPIIKQRREEREKAWKEECIQKQKKFEEEIVKEMQDLYLSTD